MWALGFSHGHEGSTMEIRSLWWSREKWADRWEKGFFVFEEMMRENEDNDKVKTKK